MFQKSNAALERALTLDPNLPLAATQLAANRVERGDYIRAYKDMKDLIARQPKNSLGHLVLGYTLRYAGLLDESARECETARSLDPGNSLVRSCAFTFSELGDSQRAMDFLNLDAGSEWSNRNAVRVLMAEGKMAEASQIAQKLPPDNMRRQFFVTCLARQSTAQTSSPEVDRAAHESEPQMLGDPDPENRYFAASYLAMCGEKDMAVRLLKSAIDGKYCAYDALQEDPGFNSIRSMPEYASLLASAKQCRDTFLAEKAKLGR
jgi:hypothetical protein